MYFEVQLPTLVGSNYFANMDIVLEGYDEAGKKTLLFIESKFTEHEGNGFREMAKMQTNSYAHNGERNEKKYLAYFPCNSVYAQSHWHKLIQLFNPEIRSGYLDGIKQEICHIIALSNLKNDECAQQAYRKHYSIGDRNRIDHPEITGEENFIFYNVLYDWKGSESFKNYKDLYCELEKMVKDIPSCSDIKMAIHSYRHIYDSIPDGELKAYLNKRYIQFSK